MLFQGKSFERLAMIWVDSDYEKHPLQRLPTAVRMLHGHQPARSKIMLQQLCFLKPEYCYIRIVISSTTSISKWGEHGSNLPVHPLLPLLLQESHQGPHPPVQVLVDVDVRLLDFRKSVSSFNMK